MESEAPIPVQELLAHSTWVRALVRRLLAEERDVDDVLQETWLAAMEHPPRERRTMRGWLGTVARNLVRQRRRREERRRGMEERAALTESLDSTASVVERASVQRSVVDAVLSLEEPYRTTVLLRYFDGLEPKEIAERTGVPDATVRTRLHRALGSLRSKLSREHGEGAAWKLALLPLLGEPLVRAGISTWAAGGAAATIAAVLGLTWWIANGIPEDPAERGAKDSAVPEPSEVLRTDASLVLREEPKSDSESTTKSPSELGSLVYGSLRSSFGANIGSELRPTVVFRSMDGEDRGARLDEAGRFALFDLPPGEYEVEVTASRHRDFHKRVELPRQTPRVCLAFEIEPALVTEVFVTGEVPRSWRDQISVVATRDLPPTSLPPAVSSRYERYGVGRFEEGPGNAGRCGWLEIHGDLPVHVSLVLGNQVVARETLAQIPPRLTFTLEPQALQALSCSLSFELVDAASGNPVREARIEIDFRGRTRMQPRVAEGDRFVLQELLPCAMRLTLIVDGFEKYWRIVSLSSGEDLVLGRIALTPATSISGRILDAQGKGLDADLRNYDRDRSIDEQISDSLQIRSDARGEFLVPDLGRHRYLVCVRAHGHGSGVFEVDASGGNVSGLQLVVPRGVPLPILVTEDADPEWELRFLDEEERVVWRTSWSGRRRFETYLAPGSYSLVYRHGTEEERVQSLRVFAEANELIRVPD